jgi:hypothetical protein
VPLARVRRSAQRGRYRNPLSRDGARDFVARAKRGLPHASLLVRYGVGSDCGIAHTEHSLLAFISMLPPPPLWYNRDSTHMCNRPHACQRALADPLRGAVWRTQYWDRLDLGQGGPPLAQPCRELDVRAVRHLASPCVTLLHGELWRAVA